MEKCFSLFFKYCLKDFSVVNFKFELDLVRVEYGSSRMNLRFLSKINFIFLVILHLTFHSLFLMDWKWCLLTFSVWTLCCSPTSLLGFLPCVVMGFSPSPFVEVRVNLRVKSTWYKYLIFYFFNQHISIKDPIFY